MWFIDQKGVSFLFDNIILWGPRESGDYIHAYGFMYVHRIDWFSHHLSRKDRIGLAGDEDTFAWYVEQPYNRIKEVSA